MKKIISFASMVAFLIISTMVVWFAVLSYCFVNTPILSFPPLDASQKRPSLMSVEVTPGMGISRLGYALHQQGLLRSPRLFIVLAHLFQPTQAIQAGEYEIIQGLSWYQLLTDMAAGRVMHRSITFIEGRTFRQIKEELDRNPYIRHTLQNATNLEIIQALGIAEPSPEGLFFPDTYFFERGDSDQAILKRAYQKMQVLLKEEWAHRDVNLLYKTPYEALIVASLLEKETALFEEQPKMAGVILQRLNKHMLLQVDPTVAYGLGNEGPIRKEDLRINTPYNTYKNYGLPPTPISMPSQTSIRAALHPLWSNAFYYVACGRHHVFSATYEAHEKAILKCER
jgi:UPF0755 protein